MKNVLEIVFYSTLIVYFAIAILGKVVGYSDCVRSTPAPAEPTSTQGERV